MKVVYCKLVAIETEEVMLAENHPTVRRSIQAGAR